MTLPREVSGESTMLVYLTDESGITPGQLGAIAENIASLITYGMPGQRITQLQLGNGEMKIRLTSGQGLAPACSCLCPKCPANHCNSIDCRGVAS
jgi:hypothetical protein